MSSTDSPTPPAQSPRTLPELRPSPLDTLMSRLLDALRHHPTGSRVSHAQELARGLEMPKEFVEALILSAQRRGLIKAASVIKGKITWAITPLGDRLIAHQRADEAPVPSSSDD